jgi:hypothetical protein
MMFWTINWLMDHRERLLDIFEEVSNDLRPVDEIKLVDLI